MQSKTKLILIMIATFSLVTICGTLAYFTDYDTRNNVIAIGKVSGILFETGETTRDDNSIGRDYKVVPRDIINKDPTVMLNDDSLPAYARIKITYNGLSNQQINELENLLVLNEGWYRSGDYFYYNEIIYPGIPHTVFNQVAIPDWGNELSKKEFRMILTGQFVQAESLDVSTIEISGTTYIAGWPLLDSDIEKAK